MKLPPVTVALVLTAAILGGFVYFSEVRGGSEPETATETARQQLFDFEEGQVKALTLTTQLRSLRFQKDDDGKWQMVEPESVPADDASIAYLLNLMATESSDRVLEVSAADRRDFGFDQPLATVAVTLDNQQEHKLILGGYDFNRSFIYAQADPAADASGLQVVLVSPEFENAVSRPVGEWQAGGGAAAPNQEAPAGGASPPSDAEPIDESPDASSPSPSPTPP